MFIKSINLTQLGAPKLACQNSQLVRTQYLLVMATNLYTYLEVNVFIFHYIKYNILFLNRMFLRNLTYDTKDNKSSSLEFYLFL